MIDEKQLGHELRELIAEILELEPEKITMEANFVEDLGVDSMMALEILASVEKKYKLKIPEENLTKINNLQATINIVRNYLNKR